MVAHPSRFVRLNDRQRALAAVSRERLKVCSQSYAHAHQAWITSLPALLRGWSDQDSPAILPEDARAYHQLKQFFARRLRTLMQRIHLAAHRRTPGCRCPGPWFHGEQGASGFPLAAPDASAT